ncbi:MAG: NAD(P)/FAD-dependent oxidoreductase [Dehalococcoidia bacterium]|nr:NAD(P)/FAD-dependent oxidoreductase [Dehalococcoidia bacterium]
MPGRSFDAIVIGAGPTGSTAARVLAAAGLRTCLLESRAWQRDKVCGGGLTLRAIAALESSGLTRRSLLEAGLLRRPITNLATQYAGLPASLLRFRSPLFYTTERRHLDAFLAQAAIEAGVRFWDGTRVDDVNPRDERVHVSTGWVELTARWVIAADGAASLVARKRFPPPDLMARAVTVTVPAQTDSRTARLDLAVPRGYGWIFPRGRGCGLSAGAASYRTGFRRLEWLLNGLLRRHGLSTSAPIARWVIPCRTRFSPVHQGRIAVAGNAAGLADPLTGEGIGPAILSGLLAAETVIEAAQAGHATLGAYSERIKQHFWPAQRRAGVAAGMFPALLPLLYLFGRFAPVRNALARRMCAFPVGPGAGSGLGHQSQPAG